METAAYYDAVNFARKFKGKSLYSVGFIDTVCPPSTVYAAFNVSIEPKRMIASPLMGHGTDHRWQSARRFFRANMKLVCTGEMQGNPWEVMDNGQWTNGDKTSEFSGRRLRYRR